MFLSCNVHVSEWIQVVSLALGFRRTYNWPEIYIFHYVLRKFIENTNKKVCTIFFTNINISFFFTLCCDLFSIIAKKSQSNQEQCSLCCSSPCFRVLLCTHYWLLHCFSKYFRKSKEIGVLRPTFPDYIISCYYDLNVLCS